MADKKKFELPLYLTPSSVTYNGQELNKLERYIDMLERNNRTLQALLEEMQRHQHISMNNVDFAYNKDWAQDLKAEIKTVRGGATDLMYMKVNFV